MWFTLIFVLFISFSDLWNIYNFSLAWVFSLFFATLFWCFYFLFKYYSWIKSWKIILEKSFFSKVFSYSIATFLSAQVWIILSQLDMQMILYLLWPEKAWYYSSYLTIVAIPFVLFWQIFWFLIPLISTYYSQKNFDLILKIRRVLIEIFFVLWLFFSLFLFVFSEEIVFSLFWEKFYDSAPILSFWALFLIFNFLLQTNFGILWWMWKARERLKIVSFWLLLAFFTNYFFINLFWEKWASLATWIWFIFMLFLSEFKLKSFSFKINYVFFLKNILFLFVCFYLLFSYFSISLLWLDSRFQTFIILFILWSLIFLAICFINFKELKNLFYIYKNK